MRTKMNCRWTMIVCVLSILAWQVPSSAQAGQYESCMGGGGWISQGGGGGNDVPTPFDLRNRSFELADGEIYELYGWIKIGPSLLGDAENKMAYLQVDLEKQGWLANSKRRDFPFYPIEADFKNLIRWELVPVKMLCRAHGRIVSRDGKTEYIVFLEPISRPCSLGVF